MNFELVYEYTRELNVLYVEDDSRMRTSTAELLESYFKTVETAADGVLGASRYLEYFERHGSYYDLVVADLNMPRKGGIEMIRQIQLLREMQPIIIISAHTEPHYLLDAIDVGVISYIVKPLNIENFVPVLYKTAKSIIEQTVLERYCKSAEHDTIELCAANRTLRERVATLEARLLEMDTATSAGGIKRVDSAEKPMHFSQQIKYLISDDLRELMDLLQEMENYLEQYRAGVIPRSDLFEIIGTLLQHYGATLAYYTYFDDLSEQIIEFAQTLRYETFPGKADDEENLMVLFDSFVQMMQRWQSHLPYADEVQLNEFDASIISDISMILMLWHPEEAARNSVVEFF